MADRKKSGKCFTTASKKKKVGITLTRQVKDLYNKSFNVLKKATEEDIENRRIAHPHGLIVLI